jgi:hypothetical protein
MPDTDVEKTIGRQGYCVLKEFHLVEKKPIAVPLLHKSRSIEKNQDILDSLAVVSNGRRRTQKDYHTRQAPYQFSGKAVPEEGFHERPPVG